MRLHLLVATLLMLFSTAAFANIECYDRLTYEASQLIGLKTDSTQIQTEPYEADFLLGLTVDVQKQLLNAEPENRICVEVTMLDEYNAKKEARDHSPVYHVEIGEHSTMHERVWVRRVYAVKAIVPYYTAHQ